jgi:excisionase family DNA binding protein
MAYTLGEAARAVGRSKTTLGRAIKTGRISATRSEDGSYLIDPAELHRVFTVTRDGHPRMERSVTLNGPEPEPSPETLAPRQLLAERESTIADLRESVRDLRTRLDTEAEDRRRMTDERRQLLGMLIDRRPWWRRWFG